MFTGCENTARSGWIHTAWISPARVSNTDHKQVLSLEAKLMIPPRPRGCSSIGERSNRMTAPLIHTGEQDLQSFRRSNDVKCLSAGGSGLGRFLCLSFVTNARCQNIQKAVAVCACVSSVSAPTQTCRESHRKWSSADPVSSSQKRAQ